MDMEPVEMYGLGKKHPFKFHLSCKWKPFIYTLGGFDWGSEMLGIVQRWLAAMCGKVFNKILLTTINYEVPNGPFFYRLTVG